MERWRRRVTVKRLTEERSWIRSKLIGGKGMKSSGGKMEEQEERERERWGRNRDKNEQEMKRYEGEEKREQK